jgi:hypothetical protein
MIASLSTIPMRMVIPMMLIVFSPVPVMNRASGTASMMVNVCSGDSNSAARIM